MKLGRRRHHLRLRRVPQHPRDRDQFFGQDAHVFREATTIEQTRQKLKKSRRNNY